jgi:hypothetical protein
MASPAEIGDENMTIHHAILKAAGKLGIGLTETGNGTICRAEYEGYYLEAATAKLALAEMKEAIENETLEELDAIEADETEADEPASVVPTKYRERYGKAGNCGDDIAAELRQYLETENDQGKPVIDRAKLEKFAKKNDLWNAAYAALNNGQVRMNVGNRLRARIRKDPEFQPVWP